MAIDLEADEADDPDYMKDVSAILGAIATGFPAKELIVVKIDNWFDHKWLHFSGKAVGAFGTWNDELTVPPFHPGRIKSEAHLSLPACQPIPNAANIHGRNTAFDARRRKVAHVAPTASLVWFCGMSKVNRHGALMAYTQMGDSTSAGQWTWYAGWEADLDWNPTRMKGISAAELSHLLTNSRSE